MCGSGLGIGSIMVRSGDSEPITSFLFEHFSGARYTQKDRGVVICPYISLLWNNLSEAVLGQWLGPWSLCQEGAASLQAPVYMDPDLVYLWSRKMINEMNRTPSSIGSWQAIPPPPFQSPHSLYPFLSPTLKIKVQLYGCIRTRGSVVSLTSTHTHIHDADTTRPRAGN